MVLVMIILLLLQSEKENGAAFFHDHIYVVANYSLNAYECVQKSEKIYS